MKKTQCVNTSKFAIGNTPLIELKSFSNNSKSRIFAKLEMYNPTGSIKDRIVDYILSKAVNEKLINQKTIVVEASSGNTGIAVARYCARGGYKSIITTPEKTSDEKINMMRAYGSEVIICPSVGSDHKDNYVNQAKAIISKTKNVYTLNQYENPDNLYCHYLYTAPEIWNQLHGNIDYLVACGSTGGTISGISKYLKTKNPKTKSILADPNGSAIYDFFKFKQINTNNIHPYKVEGAGKDRICNCMDLSIIDDVIQFSDKDALLQIKKLAKEEGILAGGSSGGALHVARKIGRNAKSNINIVVILPDSGERYLSTLWRFSEEPLF